MAEERIQKILAQAGYGSRRACEKFIQAGRVRVNGVVAAIGDKADPLRDEIMLDGKSVRPPERYEYIMLNKPRFVLSSRETQGGHKTVFDLVESSGRLFAVGRLDLESEGLVLLTNDGELANRLTHPRYGHDKEYRVLLASIPDAKQLATWQRGVVLEDGHSTGKVDVRLERKQGKGAWVRVTMGEGHKRQIRETARTIGLNVVKLIRVRLGPLLLGRLPTGKSRSLHEDEIAALKGHTPKKPQSRSTRKPSGRPSPKSRTRPVARRSGNKPPKKN
jgi:23S rRNA pseudouridine2605 synthase